MNKKLMIACIITLSLQLGISAIAQDAPSPKKTAKDRQFQGSWSYYGVTEEVGTCSFSLDIKQDGDKIKGFYSAVALNGNKIDDDEEEKPNVMGTVKGNVAEAEFKSDWEGTGKVKITHMGDSLKWEIIRGTEKGTFWCPYIAVLERDKEE